MLKFAEKRDLPESRARHALVLNLEANALQVGRTRGGGAGKWSVNDWQLRTRAGLRGALTFSATMSPVTKSFAL